MRDTLQEIRSEAGWDPLDGEPTDYEALERYISALEAQVRAADLLTPPSRVDRDRRGSLVRGVTRGYFGIGIEGPKTPENLTRVTGGSP